MTKQPYRNNGRVVVSVVDDNPKAKAWNRIIAQAARLRWFGEWWAKNRGIHGRQKQPVEVALTALIASVS